MFSSPQRFLTALVIGVLTTVIGGFLLAIIVTQCRDWREIRETVHHWQQERHAPKPTPREGD